MQFFLKFFQLPPTKTLLRTAAVIEPFTRDPNVKKSVKSRIFKDNLYFFCQVEHKRFIQKILSFADPV